MERFVICNLFFSAVSSCVNGVMSDQRNEIGAMDN